MNARTPRRPARWFACASFALALTSAAVAAEPSRAEALERRFAEIERDMTGRLGVYVLHSGQGWSASHRGDRDWYLASTIKLPLAIALLQQAENGEWSLDEQLELAESDFVDGSGELLWREPGERFSLDELNRRSLRDSDSTATDMLIRRLGEDRFNQLVAGFAGDEAFGPITTILQVRHDAWSEVHPDAAKLSNLDFIDLSTEQDADRRHGRVLEMLRIKADQADARTTREAFERYYERGYNHGNLADFATLLDQLVKGRLLSNRSRERLFDIMESVNTGDQRIKAGLPEGTPFAHKTGTQIERACNIGIIHPRTPEKAIVVAACAERFGDLAEAERAFRRVGQALSELAM